MALEDAEEDAPGAHGLAVLVGHEARKLMEVSEVVRGPGGEKLAEPDGAEIGMAAAAVEVAGLDVQRAELGEACGSDGGEFIEELRQGFALRFFVLSLAVEGLEGLRLAVMQDHCGAGNPVGVFGMDEVADDVEGGPGVGAFVGVSPGFGKVAEERVESGGSAGEQGNGLVESGWHVGAPVARLARGSRDY